MRFYHKGPNGGSFDLVDASRIKFNGDQFNKDCYKIIWARNEAIALGVDGYRVHLREKHLLFASPLNQLDLCIESKDVFLYAFNREFYCIRDHDSEVACNGFLFLGSSSPLMVALDSKELKTFNLLREFFIEEFENNKDHLQGEMLLVLLKRLLIISVRIARKTLPVDDMPSSKLDTIRHFKLLVEQHFREKHKVQDYAELMHMSPKSISNVFARYFNKTPLQVINDRLILEGKRLLEFSSNNINEIAYKLGFHEAAHFSKFFKVQTGSSPSQYVKSLHMPIAQLNT